MTRPVNAVAHLEVAGEWFRVTGEVWIGTTGTDGPDPTEVGWRVVGDSDDRLIDAIYESTELCRSECVEMVEQALIDAVRDVG